MQTKELEARIQDGELVNEITGFLKERGYLVQDFLGEGTINIGMLVENSATGGLNVATFGLLVPFGVANIQSIKRAGYMDPQKFTKAKAVTDFLRYRKLPAIEFIDAGTLVIGGHLCAWGIQKLAEGVPLSRIWSEMTHSERMTISQKIVSIMAVMHELPAPKEAFPFNGSAEDWYRSCFDEILQDGVACHGFSAAEAIEISEAAEIAISMAHPRDTIGLIHGDLFQPNIFVDPDPRIQSITSIIDWETSLSGHTGYDQILTAWWLSGEHSGDREIFNQIISEFSNNTNVAGFDRATIDEAITLVDLLWHTNIIVACTMTRKTSEVPRWKERLKCIIGCIIGGKNYAQSC